MVVLNGIEVWIEQRDEAGNWSISKEFQVNDTGVAVKCFIASKVGSQFRIGMRNRRETSSESMGLWCTIHIDGQQAGLNALMQGWKSAYFSGARISATEERPFCFVNLATTDDESKANADKGGIKKVGSIRIGLGRTMHGQAMPFVPTVNMSKVTVLENVKKAATAHTVDLAPAVQVPLMSSVLATYIDHSSHPQMTFEFRYRSADMLEIEGIKAATESDSVVKVPKKPKRGRTRDDKAATPTVREQAAKIEQLQEEVNQLRKRAKVKTPSQTKPAETVEPPASARELIDLTVDDD